MQPHVWEEWRGSWKHDGIKCEEASLFLEREEETLGVEGRGSLAEEKGGEIPKELIDCLCVYRNNHAPTEVLSNVPCGGREIGSGDTKPVRGIRVSV